MSDRVQRKPTPRSKKPRSLASSRTSTTSTSEGRRSFSNGSGLVSHKTFFTRIASRFISSSKRTTGASASSDALGSDSSVPSFLTSPASKRAGQIPRTRGSRASVASASKPFNLLSWLRSLSIHHIIHLFSALVALLVVIGIGYFVLLHVPICTITSVVAHDSEHVSAQDIAQLAQIEDGTTLFNLDEKKVADRIKKNPWVSQVHFTRKFPASLDISVDEKAIDAYVLIGSSNVVWTLGNDNVWIEPISLPKSDDNVSFKEKTLTKAHEAGVVAFCDLPASVNPQPGAPATDDTITMIQSYRHQFSPEFSQMVASYSAPTPESITLTLTSGVEVSVGIATQVPTKERIIREILTKYEGKLTYINVRVPSKPSYRMVQSDSVKQGRGVNS